MEEVVLSEYRETLADLKALEATRADTIPFFKAAEEQAKQQLIKAMLARHATIVLLPSQKQGPIDQDEGSGKRYLRVVKRTTHHTINETTLDAVFEAMRNAAQPAAASLPSGLSAVVARIGELLAPAPPKRKKARTVKDEVSVKRDSVDVDLVTVLCQVFGELVTRVTSNATENGDIEISKSRERGLKTPDYELEALFTGPIQASFNEWMTAKEQFVKESRYIYKRRKDLVETAARLEKDILALAPNAIQQALPSMTEFEEHQFEPLQGQRIKVKTVVHTSKRPITKTEFVDSARTIVEDIIANKLLIPRTHTFSLTDEPTSIEAQLLSNVPWVDFVDNLQAAILAWYHERPKLVEREVKIEVVN